LKHPKKFTGVRYWAVRSAFYFCARLALFGISNVYWVSQSRPKVCYKKYLGKEWKADYGLAGSMVANHTAFQDVFVHSFFTIPSFVMKASAAKIPAIAQMASLTSCLAIGSDKKQIGEDIMERQRLASIGETEELLIHAEGGTTNGHLI